MNKKVLDIWAVQNIESELEVALANIKTNDAIIFDNAAVELTIGDKQIKDKVFSCAIFSEESDTLVLIMKHAKVDTHDAIKYLEQKGIHYHLVSFCESQKAKPDFETPGIWFARDPYVVADACDDSLGKGITNLTYDFDKEKTAELKFTYRASFDDKKLTFDDKVNFKGLINLEDKIILVVNSEKLSEKQEDMEQILIDKGFADVQNCTVTI